MLRFLKAIGYAVKALVLIPAGLWAMARIEAEDARVTAARYRPTSPVDLP